MVPEYNDKVGMSVVLYDAQKLDWKPSYGLRSSVDTSIQKDVICHNNRYAIIRHRYRVARLQQEQKGKMWEYVLELSEANIERHPDYCGGPFGLGYDAWNTPIIRICRYQKTYMFSDKLHFSDIPDYCSDSDFYSSDSYKNVIYGYNYWQSDIMDKKRKYMELEQELAAYKQMIKAA